MKVREKFPPRERGNLEKRLQREKGRIFKN
jgi:hypothetical protein